MSKATEASPLNGCSACGADFTGLTYFDRHRVGVHQFTYSEGLAMTPMCEDGRRCLSASELTELGWEKNAKGRWFDPAASERLREVFSALPNDGEATEGPVAA